MRVQESCGKVVVFCQWKSGNPRMETCEWWQCGCTPCIVPIKV